MNFTHLDLTQLSKKIEGTNEKLFELFRPPPKRTISEWADQFRVLGSEASSEAGQWRTSRAEYQREIMDEISNPLVEEVVIMSSAQIGKSEILLNSIGYYIDQDPSPMLCLQPTLDMAEAFSKDRIAPMIRLASVLNSKIKDPRARDSNNTLLHKGFSGGHLTLSASNSPAGLASRPVKCLFLDEVDRYPASAGSEGDPVNLARARTSNFLSRKIVLTSTPTIKGISRIENSYNNSDKRVFLVPCPDCNHDQQLLWNSVRWDNDDAETAKYECNNCGSFWSDSQRWGAVKKGHWKATRKSKVAGFHLSALYSPWGQLEKFVDQYLHARELPELLKTFVNTILGETFEDEGEGVDDMGLYNRREKYLDEVPEAVQAITAGVDVQDDRLEVSFIGWTRNQESFVIDHKIILEDPSTSGCWELLDEILKTQWSQGEYFQRCRIACIDTGGHFTQTVYQYTKNTKGVYPIKGIGGFGRPIIGRTSRNNKERVRLYPIGVDTAKELIYARLKQEKIGEGYIHFPEHLDEEYFKQLTAERIQKRIHKGYLKREFVKRYSRNESLDCMVYAYSAFLLMPQGLFNKDPKKKTEIELKPDPIVEEPVEVTPEEPKKLTKRKRRKVIFKKSLS